MDIHFCDLCGARVTDVDLRGGHGICRQYDVICATCVELGHGKEWLKQSQQRQHQRNPTSQAAPHVAAATAAAASTKSSAPIADVITAANVINTAIDRAQTLEDGQEPESVSPQAVNPEALADADDLIDEDHSSAGDFTPESVPVLNNQFASAANSFSAMGRQSKPSDKNDDVDEEEHGEGLSDESAAAPILAESEAAKSTDDAAASPFEFDEHKGGKDEQSQKDETLPSDRDPLMAEKPSQSSSRKATSASASFKRSGNGSKSSSANPKAATSKSGKNVPKVSGRSRAKNKNKNIVMMSAISVGILFMIGLIILAGTSKPRSEQVIDKVDLSENVKSAIKDAKSTAIIAIRSKDVPALKAAKIKIQALQPEIYKFADEAKKQGWTDEEMGHYMDIVGWPDTNMLLRNITEEITKQGQR
jgi:hypothetical protein